MGIMRDPELMVVGGSTASRGRNADRLKIGEYVLLVFCFVVTVVLCFVGAVFGDDEGNQDEQE